MARLFFLRPLLRLDQGLQVRFERLDGLQQGGVTLVVNDAAARSGRQVQEWHIDQSLQIPGGPGCVLEPGQCREIVDDSGPCASERDPITLGGLGEIEFGVGVAERRTDRGELMQQPSLVGARLDLVLLARKLVDHRHANLGVADSVAQLRGQIPLDLLAGKGTDSLQQGADAKLRAAFGEQDPSRAHRVPRVALAHRHLVGTLVASGRDHRKLVADRPERQQSDPELALYAVCRPFCLQSPLDRIADMRRNVLEVRPALLIAGNAIAVILNR